MFLQLKQNQETGISLLQYSFLQENWQWILGISFCMFVFWRVFKRKRNRREQLSNLMSSKAKNCTSSKTNKVYKNIDKPNNQYPMFNEATLVESKQIESKEEKKGPAVQGLQEKPTNEKVKRVTIESSQIEVVPIVSEPSKQKNVVKYIGYDPRKLATYAQQLYYPYIVLPQPNSIVTWPQKGRIGRQGYKDADFQNSLSKAFGQIFQIDDNLLISANSGVIHSPDIALIDTTSSVNLFIDIEIDEPYEGTNDVANRQAIHYRGCDDNRDNTFVNNGWIVIRFAEIQVHQNPVECCRYIADVISKIHLEFAFPNSLKNVNAIQPALRWTQEEAEILSKNREREKYLGINGFGVVPENKIIHKAIPATNNWPIENILSQQTVEKKELLQKEKPTVFSPDNTSTTTPNVFELIPFKDIRSENIVASATNLRHAAYHKKQSISNLTKTYWGFRNSQNEVIVKAIYDAVKPFSEGLAAIQLNNKWGFINAKGEVCIQCIYDDVRSFTGDVAAVRLNFKWGVINKAGTLKTPCEYQEVSNFSDGFASIKQNNKWGFINTEGKLVIRCIYDWEVKRGWHSSMFTTPRFDNGLALVYYNNRCGFIDKKGNEIIPLTYGDARGFSEGFAAVSRNSKFDKNGLIGNYGFINKKNQAITSFNYERVKEFSEGLAAVERNSKWGYVNYSGREVIPCKYGSASSFENGLAKVQLYGSSSGYFGYIDKNDREIIPCKYTMVGDFSDGLAVVKRDYYYGYVDMEGNEVIKPIYREAEPFIDGVAKVKLTHKDHYKYIDKRGKIVENEAEYDDLPF
jgi:hypothetical protein